MRIFCSVIASLLVLSSCLAQDVSNSKRGSEYTFVYKISDQTAANAYGDKNPNYNRHDFNLLVDSFLVNTHSFSNKRQPVGHYLFVTAINENAEISLRSFNNVDAKVLNNERDLIVVVYDSAGRECSEAEVSIKHTRVLYDPSTRTYRSKHSNKKGILTVNYRGHNSYFEIERRYEHNNGKPLRKLVLLTYRAPFRYLLSPFRYVVRGVKYPRTFLYPIDRMKQVLDNHKNKDRIVKIGYLILNKPKYLPKDTVKLKALVLNKHGKPFNKKLAAYYQPLKEDDQSVYLESLRPMTSGAFVHEFVLPDSLELDKSYQVLLKRRKRTVSRNTFLLEDYELDQVNYSLRMNQTEYYPGQPIKIFAKGINSYGMNTMDGKIKLSILTERIGDIESHNVFIPNVLWETQDKLDLLGETSFTLPDSVIPSGVHLTLRVKASFTNSSNELQEQSTTFEIHPIDKRIAVKVNPNDIVATYLNLNKERIKKGKLRVFYEAETRIDSFNITFPYKANINPLAVRYEFYTDSAKATEVLAKSPSLVSCIYIEKKDSIILQLSNPRKLQVKYFIYKANREIYRGYADSLNIFLPMIKGVYTTSIQWVWGGTSFDKNYHYYQLKKQLNVELEQPEVIYSGQQSDVKIRVTDYRNRPVGNVNIAAFSVNAQFKTSNTPQLPDFGEKLGKSKLIYNYFNSTTLSNRSSHKFLQSSGLFQRLHLDTNVFFSFLFPGNRLFQQYNVTGDSVTQFSPYVMRKGVPQEIALIY
ncbi:MAG TPA: hypothetical protein VF691_21985, partial [Cytophagaceae bacterium]